MNTRLLFALVGLALWGATGAAQAQLDVTLTPVSILVPKGAETTLTYRATFVNNFAFDLYLNSSFATTDAPLSLNSDLYDAFFVFPTDPQTGDLLDQPFLAANGGAVTTDIFTVTVPRTAPDGVYHGLFVFQGGAGTDTSDPLNMGDLYQARFSIQNVIPAGSVPEPGATAAAVTFALAGTTLVALRRKKR